MRPCSQAAENGLQHKRIFFWIFILGDLSAPSEQIPHGKRFFQSYICWQTFFTPSQKRIRNGPTRPEVRSQRLPIIIIMIIYHIPFSSEYESPRHLYAVQAFVLSPESDISLVSSLRSSSVCSWRHNPSATKTRPRL